MNTSRKTFVLGVLFSLLPCPASARDDAFAADQAWSIRGLPGSHIVIGRVESYGEDTAIHISAIVAQGTSPPLVMAHLPFSQSAIAGSVDTLISSDAKVDDNFETGYGIWREAALAGRAGVFDITVADAIQSLIGMMPGKLE